ncbi:MAG: peptide deformylase [Pseudomonadales bacterium]
MAIQPILRMGHPNLRTEASDYPVDQIGTDAFSMLIENMRDTLKDAGGIGLAAPQIDVPFRVVIIDIPEGKSRYGVLSALGFTVLINPVITVLDESTAGFWEGCLSVPGLRGYVERPQSIKVSYLDDQGQTIEHEFMGFPATVVQHELDHLAGRLYIDHIKDTTLLSFEAEFDRYLAEPSRP